MSFTQFLLIVATAVVLIGMPVAMAWTVVDYVRGRSRRERRGGSSSAGVGAAFQELDRLVARPSVEHIVEAERAPLLREDDRGGE